MVRFVCGLLRHTDGTTSIEYALIAVGIGVAIAIAVNALGHDLFTLVLGVSNQVQAAVR